ncbi:MAG: type II toxin-antitoxin system HicB family antitoxin [Thermoplasmatota archaeon]
MRRYLIVIEKAGRGFSAYSPDVPGCVATGGTRELTQRRMRAAMRAHVAMIREERSSLPPAAASAEYVAVE